jgi:hypothetical protein
MCTEASETEPTMTTRFQALAALLSVAAAVAGLAYSVAFAADVDAAEGAFLLAGGLLVTVVFVALYELLRPVDPGFALLMLVFGVAGGIGAMVHGGYDLANAIEAPEQDVTDLPSAIDPRGLLTFGVTALAIALAAFLARRGRLLPPGLTRLGFASAALLVILYAGRLGGLEADDPALVVPALLEGLLVNPAWYAWLGRELRRNDTLEQAAPVGMNPD